MQLFTFFFSPLFSLIHPILPSVACFLILFSCILKRSGCNKIFEGEKVFLSTSSVDEKAKYLLRLDSFLGLPSETENKGDFVKIVSTIIII